MVENMLIEKGKHVENIYNQDIKTLPKEFIRVFHNEYKRRWRLRNKDKVKAMNDRHYKKFYKKKSEDTLKDTNKQEDTLINPVETLSKKVSVGSIYDDRGLLWGLFVGLLVI